MIKSPLRYPGGKSRAVKNILPLFPAGVTNVCSPFMGGGSVEINLAANGINVFAYDKFKPLVKFWDLLQNKKDFLAGEIQLFYPLKKEEFYQLQCFHLDTDGLDQAVYFYVLNRSSFDGTTLSGGCSNPSSRFTQSSIDRIRDWQKLDKLKVDYADFKDSIPARKDNFIFADPPYMIKSNLYGNKGSHHKDFDHQALFELLNNRDGWILCYNDCPTIREMYSRFKIIEPEWSYGMGKNKKSKEILILN